MSDLAAEIKAQYGSIAKFAKRVGVHRSTLSRVLAGTYSGNAASVQARIANQFRVDGVRIDEAALPGWPDRSLSELGARLDAVLGSLHMARRVCKAPDISALLAVASDELMAIRGEISGR